MNYFEGLHSSQEKQNSQLPPKCHYIARGVPDFIADSYFEGGGY